MYSLVAAIAFGSLFAILFKLFQRHGVDSLQAIGVNYATALIISLNKRRTTRVRVTSPNFVCTFGRS
jgi:uncharacterized membrane protein (UPF0136 family)